MSNKLLQDSAGNTSSKRVFGAIGMGLFFVAAIGMGVYSIFTGNDIGNNATQLVSMVGIVSGSLLGIGVLEGVRKGQ